MIHLSEMIKGHVGFGCGLVQKFSNLTTAPFCFIFRFILIRATRWCLQISRSYVLSHSYSGQGEIFFFFWLLSQKSEGVSLPNLMSCFFPINISRKMTNNLLVFGQSEPTLVWGTEVGGVKHGMCWEMVNIHPNEIGITYPRGRENISWALKLAKV